MTIYTTATKLKRNQDPTIAQVIITSFTNQFRGW